MTITNARGHLSSETIDLLLLSALSAPEANDAKAHLDTCTDCKQRWVELNEDSMKFKQFVFARTLPQVEARVAEARGSVFERFRLAWLVPAFGLATAAAVAFSVAGGPGTQTEDDVYIGVKGNEPSFEVFAQRERGAAFQVKSGMALRPKDRIRFVVGPAQARYVLVASLDGNGAFSVYHPFGAAESERINEQVPRRLELASTVELDETTGTERVVLVLSDAPVRADVVKAALALNPTAPKLEGAKVITQEFVKVAP